MYKSKDSSGITLLSLVITIILLLILAGVVLNMLLNGGILEKTREAIEKHNSAVTNEQQGFNRLDEYIR